MKNVRTGLNNRFSRLIKMNQQTFKTSPVKRILVYLAAFAATFVSTSIFLTGERLKTYYWAINTLVFVVCFLLVFFEEDTTIICNEVGCAVKKKRFWENSGTSFGFGWNEVSETEYYADAETSREFYVEINGVRTKLLTADFSSDDFDSFIETVNQATTHLPYVWEKNDYLVGSVFEGRRYSKIIKRDFHIGKLF